MDLGLINLQRLICDKTQTTNQPSFSLYIYKYMCVCSYIYTRRHSWCNGYRRRKWTWRPEFKPSMRLFAHHIAQILLEKEWIQLFSLQTELFNHGMATSLGEKKNSEFKPVKLCIKNRPCDIPCLWRRGWVNTYMCVCVWK